MDSEAVFSSRYFSPNKNIAEFEGFLTVLVGNPEMHKGKEQAIRGDFNETTTTVVLNYEERHRFEEVVEGAKPEQREW